MRRTVLLSLVTLLLLAGGYLLWPRQTPEILHTFARPANSPKTHATLSTADTVQDLQARLDAATAAKAKAEQETALLRDKISALDGNVIVSYGKVEDIGKRFGSMLLVAEELRQLAARDPKSLTPEEQRRLVELQRQHAEVLGMLPEITAFQDKPTEYGQFFRNLVGQAAHLNDTQAQQVQNYMTDRAVAMNQAGLNASRQPGNFIAQGVWELRRDHFNEQTASGLTALLPQGAAEQAGVGAPLMEFLEMDFDKSGTTPP